MAGHITNNDSMKSRIAPGHANSNAGSSQRPGAPGATSSGRKNSSMNSRNVPRDSGNGSSKGRSGDGKRERPRQGRGNRGAKNNALVSGQMRREFSQMAGELDGKKEISALVDEVPSFVKERIAADVLERQKLNDKKASEAAREARAAAEKDEFVKEVTNKYFQWGPDRVTSFEAPTSHKAWFVTIIIVMTALWIVLFNSVPFYDEFGYYATYIVFVLYCNPSESTALVRLDYGFVEPDLVCRGYRITFGFLFFVCLSLLVIVWNSRLVSQPRSYGGKRYVWKVFSPTVSTGVMGGRPDAFLKSEVIHTDPRLMIVGFLDRDAPLPPSGKHEWRMLTVSAELVSQCLASYVVGMADDEVACKRIKELCRTCGSINLDRYDWVRGESISDNSAMFAYSVYCSNKAKTADIPFFDAQ